MTQSPSVPIELNPEPPRHDWRQEHLTPGRRPDWLRVRAPDSAKYYELKGLFRGKTLHTVCEEAGCPNIGECWNAGTATFLLLGDTCTRSCGFCHVKTGRPASLDLDEPRRVADSVRLMDLKYVVITSVNRDELPDGGAGIFAETIRLIRERMPQTTIEVLIPDFMGNRDALQMVMRQQPEILNHNVETVPRLYGRVRPQAKYPRSLDVLAEAKVMDAGALTKSGMMVGLGERWEEVLQVMDDLRAHNVDILTIGQYLQPSRFHLPIERYYTPEEFAQLRAEAEARGFPWVECGPLVRSSYHAERAASNAPRLRRREATVGS